MIHLESTGTAYEIGKQHGRDCAAAVRAAYRAWGPAGATGGECVGPASEHLRRFRLRRPNSSPPLRERMEEDAVGHRATGHRRQS